MGGGARDDAAIDLVLKDHNPTIATWVHNQGVGTVQDDPVAVPPIERHERIAALGTSRPSREVIAELEDRIVSDRVEEVFAIYKTGKPPLNHVEEWVERGEGRVFGFHDELPLRAADAVICRGASIGQPA